MSDETAPTRSLSSPVWWPAKKDAGSERTRIMMDACSGTLSLVLTRLVTKPFATPMSIDEMVTPTIRVMTGSTTEVWPLSMTGPKMILVTLGVTVPKSVEMSVVPMRAT